MVYSVTLNPCLDYAYKLEDLRVGSTNRAVSEHILAGGKGINFSAVLTELGVENTALGFVGGFVGEEIIRRVELAGIRSDFVKLSSGNSRICFKIKAGSETEVNGVGPDIPDDSLEKFFEKIDRISPGDHLLLAGSIPGSLPQDIYKTISEKVANKNVGLLVDTSGESLLTVLKNEPFLIKPNHHELGELFGTKITSREEAGNYAEKLRGMGARNVLVSMAGMGAVLAAENGQVYTCEAPKGTLVNSVGAGDSMAAGFLAGWLESGDYVHSLKMGISAGSASAFSENLAKREEIIRLYKTL